MRRQIISPATGTRPAGSCGIYGARKRCQAEWRGREGIVYADIDLGTISLAKAFADPVGHYSRPDVLQLAFDPTPKRRVVGIEGDGPSRVRLEARPAPAPEPEDAIEAMGMPAAQ